MITREDAKKVIEQLSKQSFPRGSLHLISTSDYYIFKKEDKKEVVEFLKNVHNL